MSTTIATDARITYQLDPPGVLGHAVRGVGYAPDLDGPATLIEGAHADVGG